MSNGLEFFVASVKHQFGSDPSESNRKKVLPECRTPPIFAREMTDDEKIAAVLDEPRFGMFTLMHYHVNHGFRNDLFREKNRVYCSHLFSLWTGLPLLVFLAQWMLYVGLLVHQVRTYDGGWCPNVAPPEQKLMMSGVALLYFTRSFYLWDNLVDRTNRHVVRSAWFSVLDAIQEFLFSLLVYAANMYIVFTEKSVSNMLLDAMAMEFLMQMDNDFESAYFKFLPGAALEVYELYFQDRGDGRPCLHYVCWLPYKLLLVALVLFPPVCFLLVFYGAICK